MCHAKATYICNRIKMVAQSKKINAICRGSLQDEKKHEKLFGCIICEVKNEWYARCSEIDKGQTVHEE